MNKDYREILKKSFKKEVARGTYNSSHFHSANSRCFFLSVLENVLAEKWHSRDVLRVLEAGMGDGAWLETIIKARTWARTKIYGFDLTPEMVDLAKKRFSDVKSSSNAEVGFLRSGNATEIESYLPENENNNGRVYNLVFCYDLLQQLPANLRIRALKKMFEVVKSGGCVIIFDKHKYSIPNLKMALRKLITRHTSFKLVPEFYLNASYPNMKKLAFLGQRKWQCRPVLIPDDDKRHYALILPKSL